jgi:hypothetical protein
MDAIRISISAIRIGDASHAPVLVTRPGGKFGFLPLMTPSIVTKPGCASLR